MIEMQIEENFGDAKDGYYILSTITEVEDLVEHTKENCPGGLCSICNDQVPDELKYHEPRDETFIPLPSIKSYNSRQTSRPPRKSRRDLENRVKELERIVQDLYYLIESTPRVI